MKPTLRQLEYLITLQRTGSFSDAAVDMNVTQSTLSAGIKELEITLGQQLAQRGRRHITLTPFGEETADNAVRILQLTDQLMARAQTMTKPLSGPLRLGVIPTIAPYLLPKILPSLQNNFPDLELQIFEDLSDRIIEDTQRGQLDLTLLALPYPTPDMVQRSLWHEDFLLATTEDHKAKTITLIDLDSDNLLLLENGHCLRDHALSACYLSPPSTRRTFSATSLPTLIQMVAGGYGSTLLPQMVANSALPQAIRTIPFRSPKPSREIGLAWKAGHPKDGDFEILAETIKTAYEID